MRRRRNADDIARFLREADRDLAKGLTISDICRTQGIAELSHLGINQLACHWHPPFFP